MQTLSGQTSARRHPKAGAVKHETRYPASVVWSDDDEAYLAWTPQLAGCIVDGCTREEALQNLEGLIAEWLVSAKNQGWKIPQPMTESDLSKRKTQAQRAFKKPLKVA